MEKDLFDWCGWDIIADTKLQFYSCTLKVPIGEFKIGDLVPCISVDFEQGTLQTFGDGDTLPTEHKVRMVLVN